MKFDLNIFYSPNSSGGGSNNSHATGELKKSLEALNSNTSSPVDINQIGVNILSGMVRINNSTTTTANGQRISNSVNNAPDVSKGKQFWDKNGFHIDVRQESFMQPLAFPNIQFIRRSSGTILGLLPFTNWEQQPWVFKEFTWVNNEDGYVCTTSNAENDVEYQADGSLKHFGKYIGGKGNAWGFDSGIEEEQWNVISNPPSIQIGSNGKEIAIPRFHFFFDKHRTLMFDSFVRIHNLWKYSTNPADPDEVAFHSHDSSIGVDYYCKYWPKDKTSTLGFSYYKTQEKSGQRGYGTIHPTKCDGATIVIDISDQYSPLMAAIPALAGAGLIAAIAWGGGGDDDEEEKEEKKEEKPAEENTNVVAAYRNFDSTMDIKDVTSGYVESFDGKQIGVLSSSANQEMPMSNYYYGTDVVINTNFVPLSDKKDDPQYMQELSDRSYSITVSYISDHGNESILSEQYVESKGAWKYNEKKYNELKLDSESVKSQFYPLPPGRYVVMMLDNADTSKYFGFAFEIFTPETKLSIGDETDPKEKTNKDLITGNMGVITKYVISKYSRYEVGTHLSFSAKYDRNVVYKLKNDTNVKQSWKLGLYRASDDKFSKALWEKKDIVFNDAKNKESDQPTSFKLGTEKKDKTFEWQSLDSGDYVMRAVGEVVYGKGDYAHTDTCEDVAVFSVVNKLKLSDGTQRAEDNATPKKGYYQPIYSNEKNIAGPLQDISEDLYFKASTYYTEDLPNTNIMLKFSDSGEHDYQKVLVNIQSGDEVGLGSDDEFDSEAGGYILDMNKKDGLEIAPGTYKLTCHDTTQKELFDDIILNLIGKATISITLSANTTGNSNTIGSSATMVSANVVYTSVLTSPVKIAGCVEILDASENSLRVVDLFGSEGGEKVNGSKGALTARETMPNTPISLSVSIGSIPTNAKSIRGYVYDTASENINASQSYYVVSEGWGGSGSADASSSSVVYSNKKSSKKKS